MRSILSNDPYWNVDESMAKLAEVCDFAKLYQSDDYKAILYIANEDIYHVFTSKGQWGVIRNDNGRFFGFDCNYIQWSEGTCHNIPDEKYPCCYKCLYLCGVTSEGFKSYILMLSGHYYPNELVVVKVNPDIEARRVDFISKGEYTLLQDGEYALCTKYVVTLKGSDDIIDDLDGNCAWSPEKAVNHYNFIQRKQQ